MNTDKNVYYSRIKGLFIPAEAHSFIEGKINNYIDKIEQYTERLENSYNKKNMAETISVMEKILEILQSVYAKQCEANIIVLLRSAKSNSLVHSEKLMRQTIADCLLLSIEMQKAQYIGTSSALKYRKIERNEDVAHALSAIGKLISTGDYEKAKSIARDMKNVEKTFLTLSAMLERREYDRARELAGTMEKEHIGHINRSVASNAHKKVLAVDDMPEILNSVNAALKSHYQVLGAPGGKVALEIINMHKIDLFFLDIDMPEMDGYELARRIRANINYASTPILFLTSNSSRDNIMKAIRLGVSDFIVKPANSLTLLAKARKYMD